MESNPKIDSRQLQVGWEKLKEVKDPLKVTAEISKVKRTSVQSSQGEGKEKKRKEEGRG